MNILLKELDIKVPFFSLISIKIEITTFEGTVNYLHRDLGKAKGILDGIAVILKGGGRDFL